MSPKRLFHPSRLAAGLITCSLLASCATAPRDDRRNPALDQAAALQKSAGSPAWNPERFIVSNLRAAEIASAQDTDRAQALAATSTAAVAKWLVAHPSDTARRYSYDGMAYDLSVGTGRGMFVPSAFQSLKPASMVPRTLVQTWEARPGVGTPLAAKWNRPPNPQAARFVSPGGYIMPVTALLEFSEISKPGKDRKAKLEFLDPTVVTDVTVGHQTRPLAADFSAPLVDNTLSIREFFLALEGLIHPEVLEARLVMLQPYDPARIPVVFIHGLVSHPRMWRDVVNELMADPKISAKYQFWVYYYPTVWPIAYSAMRLRGDLAAVDNALGKQKRMVLVGHSMGGLLARMQVVSPGEALARASIPPDRMDRFKKLPPENIARKSMEFHANPAIERVVFISTPHRGSRVADWSLTTWFTKFLTLPSKLTSSVIDVLPAMTKSPGQYSSISRLSPSNPLYKVLEPLPIQGPHHSIMGDRGRRDTPNSSDGIVPYSSSHLASAESELVVPSDHGAYDDPAAIAELKRILRKN